MRRRAVFCFCGLVLAGCTTPGLTPRETADLDKAATTEFSTQDNAGIEAWLIAASRGRAVRHGGLALKTAGAPVVLTDIPCDGAKPDTAHCVYYTLVADLPSRRLFVVARSYYEGGDYLLVDAATGARDTLAALPHFSPSGARFATADNDEAYGSGALEIWEDRSGRYVRVWHHDQDGEPGHTFRLVHWDGEDCVRLVMAMPDGDGTHWDARIDRDGAGWHLKAAWP